jgi:hypothetical protein
MRWNCAKTKYVDAKRRRGDTSSDRQLETRATVV